MLRDGDTLSRIGGDEFVAVLVDLDSFEDSLPILNRLLEAVAEPVMVGGARLNVSASLGVTFYPQDEEIEADQLQRQADQAMYQAKQGGKNRFHVFDAVQDRSIRGHNESIERIQLALKGREFKLYYQPKVNMRTGEVVGAEALIRWEHPENGLLAPAAFLPVIENHELAVSIGEWVIDSALIQMEEWHKLGLEIPVSVNVGARQLQQEDFLDRLRTILAKHPQLQTGSLQLEVLETSALEDIAEVSKIIKACARMGVQFALDDFGTGYSSLTYLKRLAVAELKIDQSFVRDMLDNPDDLAILDGIIGLANAFRRVVIAEGVETVEHGEMLLQLGCEKAQGYGIARPMPADQFPGWIVSWKPPLSWVKIRTVKYEDLSLLYALVEHRSWIETLKRYFEGQRIAPPQMNHHKCRFGVMIDKMRQNGSGSKARFSHIDPLHQRVHELANELCELKESGHVNVVMSRMKELFSLRDELLDHLKQLLANG
jgi:EAL domain-containing protein (putative c-di-GMP-specific phosphodiesterase class I)